MCNTKYTIFIFDFKNILSFVGFCPQNSTPRRYFVRIRSLKTSCIDGRSSCFNVQHLQHNDHMSPFSFASGPSHFGLSGKTPFPTALITAPSLTMRAYGTSFVRSSNKVIPKAQTSHFGLERMVQIRRDGNIRKGSNGCSDVCSPARLFR